MAKFVKGQSGNPEGRPKGIPNKITGDMRGEVWRVFNALKEEGKGLLEVARENPTWFYSVFGARMLPRDMNLGGEAISDSLAAIANSLAEKIKSKEEAAISTQWGKRHALCGP